MVTYKSVCCANHRVIFRGVFARLRNYLWWRKHNECPCEGC